MKPAEVKETRHHQLARLDAMMDEDIDFSDLPPRIGVPRTRPGARPSASGAGWTVRARGRAVSA
jgi:hypothetical protein